ncbi:MAG: alpha/beta hydrolase [Candidatus Lernaella stagnicola]|nr:alpha/beta hydrolase [Candidatus Lernaella stagnicola]
MHYLPRSLVRLLILTVAISLVGCLADSKVADKEWNAYVGPHRHDLALDGYKLHYIDIGRGEPVFLLHGFAANTYSWKRNAQPIVDAGFRVILVDLPGQGFSGVPPKNYAASVENIAGAVLQLADHLKLDKFNVVGVSMGGGLTLYLTWKHPDRIKRSVVLDPASFDQEVPLVLRMLTTPGLGAVLAEVNGRWTVENSLKKITVQRDFLTKTFVDEYTRPLTKPGFNQFIRRLMSDFFSPEFARMVANYDTIKRPMLIIWGKQDPWIPLEFGERLHALVPDSELLVIDDCGHMVQAERPEVVNPAVIDFLSGK